MWAAPLPSGATAVVPVFVISLYVLGTLTALEVGRIARTGAPVPPSEVIVTTAAGETSEPML